MKVNEEYTAEIEKVTNLGAGIAKIDGFVVFVENTCPGDIIKIKITKVNKNFANGKISEIITPSSHRVKPFCPMYNACGACQLQFIDYDYQLELKQKITEETIRSISGLDIEIQKTISSPEIKNYRRKIQYPISQTKNPAVLQSSLDCKTLYLSYQFQVFLHEYSPYKIFQNDLLQTFYLHLLPT